MAIRSPGVYIREMDQSDFVVPFGGTVGAFIGAATKGPVNEPTLCTSEGDLVNKFGAPFAGDYGLHAAAQFLRQANRLYYLRVANGEATASIGVAQPSLALPANHGLTISAKSPGTWGNDLRVRIYDIVPTVPAGFFRFNLEVLAPIDLEKTQWGSVEKWETNEDDQKLSTDPTSPYSAEVILSEGSINLQLVASDYIDITIVNGAIEPLALPAPGWTEDYWPLGYAGVFYLVPGAWSPVAGDDGIPPGGIPDADYIGTIVGQTATGLKAFANVETLEIDVLAIPGVSSINVIEGAGGLFDTCESRGDCFGLVDPPYGLDVDGIRAWHNGTAPYAHAKMNTSYAAVYWAWVKGYDIYTQQEMWLPPSCAAARQIAYTDAVAQPWYAPAGLTRGRITGISAIEMSPDQGQRDSLYTGGNNVNCLVAMPEGVHIWGQKTLLRRNSALQSINVRRLCCLCKRVMAKSTRSLVFEPNDTTLWAQFVGLLRPFFDSLKTNRGVYDYRIICDANTNPSAQIDQGILTGRVFIQPTRAAEQINIDFIIQKTGAQFNEG